MKHACKELERMMVEAQSRGFRFERRTNGFMAYSSNKSVPPRIMHMGEKGLHPFRRWVNHPMHT